MTKKARLSEEAANALGRPELAGQEVTYQASFPKLWKGKEHPINIYHEQSRLDIPFMVVDGTIIPFKPEGEATTES